MRTLILYKTKYGSTKQYSEWLHEEIPNSEIFSADVFNPKRLNEFDTVLLGSCIYMGDIKGKRFLTNNWDVLKEKNIYLFFVGIMFDEGWENNLNILPEHIRKNVKYCKIPGGINYSKLNTVERLLFKMTKSEESDMVEKKNLKPILDYVKSLED